MADPCTGLVVVTESPTVPTLTTETASAQTVTPESGSAITPASESATSESATQEASGAEIVVELDPDDCCGEPEAQVGFIFAEDLPAREFQDEFETETHTLGGEGTTALRPDSVAFNRLYAFSIGPVNIGDASLGARNRVWYARVDNDLGKVFVARSSDGGNTWDAETELFSFVGTVLEMDMAFEQAGRPVVALQIGSDIYLYWFNPLVAAFQLTNFDTGRTPAVILDNPADTTDSDVLLFYIRDVSNLVVYRQQRDRYATRYDTAYGTDANDYVQKVIRTTDNRVATLLLVRNTVTGRYSIDRLESTLYPFIIDIEEVECECVLVSGNLFAQIIDHVLFDKEEVESECTLVSGTLVNPLILHTLFDKEEIESEATLISGTLVVIIVSNVLFDIEEVEHECTLISGTLVVIVFDHVLFDKEEVEHECTLVSGTLVNA